MSEAAGQARTTSGNEFTPTFPQSMRDTGIQQDAGTVIDRESVLRVIAKHEPIKRNEIAEKLGVPPAVINTHLSKLKDTDKIFQNQDGAYLLSDVAAMSELATNQPQELPHDEQSGNTAEPALNHEPQRSESLHPLHLIAEVIGETIVEARARQATDEAIQKQSENESEAPMFDDELTAALGLIERRLAEPKGITPLKDSDIRIVALRNFIPMLADDIAEKFESLIAEVTMAGAQ